MTTQLALAFAPAEPAPDVAALRAAYVAGGLAVWSDQTLNALNEQRATMVLCWLAEDEYREEA